MTDKHYVYWEPYGPRDYTQCTTEASAYLRAEALAAQGRSCRIITTTGMSRDEHTATLRGLRRDYATRVAS